MLSYKLLAVAALTTLAAASPIPAASPTPSTTQTLSNPTLSLWDSTRDSITFNSTAGGLVQRSAGFDDVSTLFTFSVPAHYAPNTCSLTFSLSAANSGIDSAGAMMQLFQDTRAASVAATSDFRGNQLATVRAVAGGFGVWGRVDGSSSGATSLQLPCSQLIAAPYLELGPVGDDVAIYFGASDGLQIAVLGA